MSGGLDEVSAFLRSLDPLRPGRRLDPASLDDDLVDLAEALNDALERIEGERRENGRRRLAVQERERREVAHELHAEIGQLLTAALLQLDQAEREDGDVTALGHAREATQQALDTARALSRRLAPLILDDLGLDDAIAALAVSVTRRTGLRVRRDVAPEALVDLDREESLVVLRIVQHRLTTVVQQGAAVAATVRVREREDGIEVVVADDGPLDEQDEDVATLREWALLVGGHLALTAGDEGTALTLRVPGGTA